MPKITLVEPQKSSKGRSAYGRKRSRFNIFLDGEFAFGADEDLVVERRLVAGKEILPDELEKLLFEAEIGKFMERMYRLWNIRPRSEKEVRNYFRIKNYELRIKGKEQISDLAAELLVKKLKQKGMLNDEEFARTWVEARRKSKQKGKIALKAELYQKGIGRQLIDEVLEEQSTPDSEEELARQALEKKLRIWKNLPKMEFRKKAYEFLMRRGFEYEVVKDVIEKYLQKR